MYLLADWYADAVEPVTPFRRRTPPPVECRTRKTEWGERRRSSPRVDSVRLGGKLRDVRRPACFSVADRRVSKLRPWLCVSYAAGMLNRSGRKTHSDRLGEDEAQKALHPQSPAGEAINSNSPDGCPAGEGLTSNSNRRTWTEDEGPTSNFVVSARAACGELRQIRSGSNSLVGDLPESESSVRSDPGNRDRAPRFLWSETLVESQTVPTLLPTKDPL